MFGSIGDMQENPCISFLLSTISTSKLPPPLLPPLSTPSGNLLCFPPDYPPTNCRLSTLREVTGAEPRVLILTSARKTCELDPVPTFLLQELIDVSLPLFTMQCNRSIREAYLQASQKRSILHPVLKRDGLDSSDSANYSSIANVTFPSKVLERTVANQLIVYLDINGLLPSQ